MDSVNKRSATYEKVASSAPPSHLPVAIEDFKKMKNENNIRLMPNNVNAGLPICHTMKYESLELVTV